MSVLQQLFFSTFGSSAPPPAPVDPYYSDVSLLLHMDGTSGSTTFTDNSPSPKTVTADGNTAVNTSIFKYGTGSAYFSGTGGILLPETNDLVLDGDFTLEVWLYRPDSSNRVVIGSSYPTVNMQIQIGSTTGLYNGSSWQVLPLNGSPSVNTWFYMVYQRQGSTVTIYQNGISLGNFISSTSYTFSGGAIGALRNYEFDRWVGYMDDLRITKGVARYTADFTPPSQAFPNTGPAPVPAPTVNITERAVPGTGLIFRCIEYENGLYLMTGSSGTMLSSTDSINWTLQPSILGITDNLRSTAYGNGTYVVVGSAGKIATSTNGTTWTARTSGTTSNLNRVEFGNGVFLAVGRANTIVRSTNNGSSWSFVTVSGTYRGIIYNSLTSTWVAVGVSGAIITSTDDGASWTTRSSGTTNELRTVNILNGVYYAVGTVGTIIKSADGITWSFNLNDSFDTTGIQHIAYGDGVYLAVGDFGLILQSNTGNEGWYRNADVVTADLNYIIYQDSKFYICGSENKLLIGVVN